LWRWVQYLKLRAISGLNWSLAKVLKPGRPLPDPIGREEQRKRARTEKRVCATEEGFNSELLIIQRSNEVLHRDNNVAVLESKLKVIELKMKIYAMNPTKIAELDIELTDIMTALSSV
jgi:hypothetical protein